MLRQTRKIRPGSGARQVPYDAIVKAPFGAIGIRVGEEAVLRLDFLPPGSLPLVATCALAERVAQQVLHYLAQPDYRFDLPLAQQGTAYQRRVWQAIAAVASGATASYGELAAQLSSAPRAVGQACGANPFPLVIPCHRVIAASGGLGGFAGQQDSQHFLLEAKRWLLAHEGALRAKP